MASFPGSCQAVGPEEARGEPDGSLREMLKAIADERNRISVRQETSGLGERNRAGAPGRAYTLRPSRVLVIRLI
ncbi:hypothetical protein EYF80_064166 [Liparis tanakae]|uniref:Uncharacterized protein n=1 Tax=Liparis tanakae TaxID=230148 RepID=A0A4Z2EAX9_9TELE|nr:hypothetical protein EYF80_064166 [Liparis tanakae]